MLTKALARAGQSPTRYVLLAAVATAVALGTYFAAGHVAKAHPRPADTATRAPSSSESKFGPAPDAAGFARVLVSVSNAFARRNGDPTRLVDPHCVEGSRGHYLCAYAVARPHRKNECHLVQAEWAQEPNSSFTVVLSGRARRCGTVRDAIHSLS